MTVAAGGRDDVSSGPSDRLVSGVAIGSVLVVDSGMRSVGGHNFSYTSAVKRAFEKSGVSVEVFASRGLPNELVERQGFRPMFSCGAYDHPLGHGFVRDLRYLHAQARVFAEELEHGLRCVLKRSPDLVFSHTLADFELLGWLLALSRGVAIPRLAVLLRQTPGYARASRLRLLLNPYWRLRRGALARLRRRLGAGLLLCTDSELLSGDYAHVYAAPIVTLPIPLAVELWEGTASPESRFAALLVQAPPSLRVGYLGDARASKGFDLLPAIIAAARARPQLSVHFVIQCPPPASGQDGTLPAGVAELRAMAERGRDVTLVAERLSAGDYADLLRALDLVLIPYQAAGYREPTSGIFAEAVALAKVTVVPAGTWMSHELARGSGLAFAAHRADAIVDAIARIQEGYPEFKARAEAMAAPWRRRHNADALVDALLAALQTTPSRIQASWCC